MRKKKFAFLCLLIRVGLTGFPSGAVPAQEARGEAVPIGLFLPTRGSEVALGREVLRGAEIAVARANRSGGVRGRPLRLVTASSDLPWEASTRELVRLIYEEKTVAILGATDARASHLAEQVITRARGEAILLTPWASETTLTRIRIPWFFRVVPDDRNQAGILAREIFSVRQARRAAIWVEDSLDSRSAAEAFIRAAPPGSVERFHAEREGSGQELAERIARREIHALVLLASPRVSADLAVRLQEGGQGVDLFGPLRLARPDFLERAGPAAEGMVITVPGVGPPETGILAAFQAEFQTAYGSLPTPPALYSHDAVTTLVEAMGRAGPGNGDRLAGALAETSTQGLTGRIRFDNNLDRDVHPALAVVRRGVLEQRFPSVD